jgi:thiamine biosynthesis lipoprotein
LLLPLLLLPLPLRAADPVQPLELRGEVFTTLYTIKVLPGAAGVTTDAVAGVVDAMTQRVNAHLSRYVPGSELDRFNKHGAGQPFPLSVDLRAMLDMSREVHALSGGAFDPTVAPLVRLWGFNDGEPLDHEPAPDLLASTRALVGLDKVTSPQPDVAVKAVEGLELDLSGIAKGYAVDLVAEGLDALGATSYMVEIGGEVRCRGEGPGGGPWRIGVQSPTDEGGIQRVLGINNLSVATSGDYRNGYVVDGKYISHTIDPATGRPVAHGLASTTVLDPSCARADALATALTVLGPEKALALCDRLGIGAYFIVHDGTRLRYSESQAFARLTATPAAPTSTQPTPAAPFWVFLIGGAVFLLAVVLLSIGGILGKRTPLKRHCSEVMCEVSPEGERRQCSCCSQHSAKGGSKEG